MVLKRRKFIQKVGLAIPIIANPFTNVFAQSGAIKENANNRLVGPKDFSFTKLNDRVWIGKDFWSIPMEDWEIKNKRLEFKGAMRNARLHLLTYVLKKDQGDFRVKSSLGLLKNNADKGSVGFTIGIKDTTDPKSVKAACYFGEGVSAGISLDGKIFMANNETPLPENFDYNNFDMELEASPKNGGYECTLTVVDNNGLKGELTYNHSGEMEGLVALEQNIQEKDGSTFWSKSISLKGNKIEYIPDNSFGPILWAMYTLSKGTLKLTAQLPPIGNKDSKKVELQFLKNGKWVKEGKMEIDTISFTTIFTINEWNSDEDIKYRLMYSMDKEKQYYDGVIREEPADRPLRFGGLTCQEWAGYPYRPLVENLEKSNPDMLYFSGDQLYEGNGGYPIKRQPEDSAILNYLGKWYMFGWAFGNIMRDRPTICTPDDHDVYQGNLWGEGGEGISFEEWEKVRDAHGGLVQTPKMVNVVYRTQCGHLPDPYDPTPLPSGITNWYTQMVYGKVSFAIVSDRLFKSGPQKLRSGEGRIDHLTAPAKPEELDSKGLNFFGNRQMEFLNGWIQDWQDANMKVLLSQTLFSNVGTHHGPKKQFLFGDLDSGGWPKSKRDEVIRTIRKASAFHINGDQHLPFMVQYSVDEVRDGGWTFCTPAISTGYPRWGQPDSVNVPFTDRPAHGLPNTGCYRDGFGNTNYIYAVGNPTDDFDLEKNRYLKAQKKASGFGIVTFDTRARTIKMEAIRFLADLDVESDENTYPGWPLTIGQDDNDGRRALGYLPRLQLKESNQVVKIINEETGEIVKSVRVKGNEYVPAVFSLAKYTLVIGEGQNERVFKEVVISTDPKQVMEV
ncbi:alkaline phosphatase D family protein [Arenibacter sp. F20364]|uniref:alkaline phosphatase D family protein n=1 Tax=Arenibacter sp. F20364 TaxID=2926415 RepID=UPI001FF526E1|nr:alkaline phosphatase D family protein [Arenibacter sp. F20364]MCK0189978.1 alkaline phosphatase D family protein [Arenibacter sp. F20364]